MLNINVAHKTYRAKVYVRINITKYYYFCQVSFFHFTTLSRNFK